MKISLRAKLTFTYLFISLFCIFFILFVIHSTIHQQFRKYVTVNQEKTFIELADLVTKSFGEDGKAPELAVVRQIGETALKSGIVLQIDTYDNTLDWCMHCESEERCSSMMDEIAANTKNQGGDMAQKSYDIIKSGKSYGKITLLYYGPFYYSSSDAKFLSLINRWFIAVAALTIMIAVCFGVFMAARLSKPIRAVAKKTEEMERGKFDEPLQLNSSSSEVDELIKGVNHLSYTLKNQKNMRKRLANDYAHELRTPLAVLRTNIEAMIDGVWEADTERLTNCNEEILRLTRMLENIDRLAEAENDTLDLNKSKFSLLELINQAVKKFQITFTDKNQTVSVRGDRQDIFADRDKMEQLLINLLSNASKYTGENGKIEVNIQKSKRYVTLSVKDNGIGIEKEKLPFVFEHLYRADDSRNSNVEGSGIGLSIVKAIAEAHGGYVTAESEIGVGSIFTVFLPVK